jgi:hypothetical protein
MPFGRSGRLLRFSGKPRSAGSGNREDHKTSEDDLHRALGRVAANWSLIEIASGLVLMGLVGSRDETLARAVVAGQRVENVWATVEALLSAYGSETTDELVVFRSWRKSANHYRRRRNEAIHSAWSLTSANGGPAAWDVMSQKAKMGARADLFPGGVTELEQLAQDIAVCEDRLIHLYSQIVEVMEDRPAVSPATSETDGRTILITPPAGTR